MSHTPRDVWLSLQVDTWMVRAHGAQRVVYISPKFIGDYATNSKTIRTTQHRTNTNHQRLLSAHDGRGAWVHSTGGDKMDHMSRYTYTPSVLSVRSRILRCSFDYHSTVTVVVCVAISGVLMLLDYPWSPTGLRSLPKISTAHRLLPYHVDTSNTSNTSNTLAIHPGVFDLKVLLEPVQSCFGGVKTTAR